MLFSINLTCTIQTDIYVDIFLIIIYKPTLYNVFISLFVYNNFRFSKIYLHFVFRLVEF